MNISENYSIQILLMLYLSRCKFFFKENGGMYARMIPCSSFFLLQTAYSAIGLVIYYCKYRLNKPIQHSGTKKASECL